MSIKEVAAHLHLGAADIEALVKDRAIPFERQGERVVFRRSEIDAWASQRILNLPSGRLADYHSRTSSQVKDLSADGAFMPRLLNCDQINISLTSRTRASVIRDLADMADRTNLLNDRAELIRLIEEREQLCSTALPGGFALLHARHHDPYLFEESFMLLGRTIQPIHFGAESGEPTDIFFLVCCQDDRIHLHTLARLCTLSLETALLTQLRSAESEQEALDALIASETEIIRRL